MAEYRATPSRFSADDWWDFLRRQSVFEDELTALLAPHDWDRIGTDDYDCSIEIYGCDEELRLSPAAQRFLHVTGFLKAYVNHKSGWQTHYNWGFGAALKCPVKGWRVNYDARTIEEVPPLWKSALGFLVLGKKASRPTDDTREATKREAQTRPNQDVASEGEGA